MKLYFDHNVYARITDRNEVGLVEDWLHATGNSILSSQVTLLEALRIPGDADRAARIRTITRLCPSFPTPHAFLDARELRDELKRVRSSWLRARPDTAAIDLHLNDHRRQWRSMRADPSYRSPEFGHVEAVLGPGVGVVRDFHSAGRALAQRDTGGQTTQDMAALLDAAWRIESMAVWHGALFERNPVMRDYWDYLSPYLLPIEITEGDWQKFWLRHCSADRLPRARTLALAGFFQQRHPISAGNALDTLHAVGLLYCDVFLTGDRAFHDALRGLRPWLPFGGKPILLDAKDSVAAQLEILLNVAEAPRRRHNLSSQP